LQLRADGIYSACACRAAVVAQRIGYNGHMHWDDDWVPYAGALATVATVAVAFSLLGFWFGG
jgi:hypothetical protein